MKVALFFECTKVGIQLQCKGYVTCLLLGFLHLLLVALLCLWLESDGVAKLPVEMDFRRVVELSPPPPSFPSETALDAEVASSADFETFNTNVFGD